MPYRLTPASPDVRRLLGITVGIVSVAAAVTACTSAAGQTDGPSTAHGTRTVAAGADAHAGSPTTKVSAEPKPAPFKLVGISPRSGANDVAADSVVEVKVSAALATSSHRPSIIPSVAGTWTKIGVTTLRFTPKVPWPAASKVTVSVPSGAAGLVSAAHQTLTSATTASFTTKNVSTLRIQQLLAELGYLPLSFHVTGPAHTGASIAVAERGTFSWKWSSAQNVLGGGWSAGNTNIVLHAALMDFQAQHGMTSDGVAGPKTTAALIAAALAHRTDSRSYNFVHVDKGSPESSTIYVDGAVRFHVPVSTGITGATTYDGIFAVFSHVYYTEMKGTDVDGTKYDDNIYWASYFNGGEAMHAYPRASYGFPQSNGCVEMNPATAKSVWPFTPLGTPVSVTG